MGAEELQRWIQAARRCAIVSPNLLEAQTILASASSTAPSQSQCGSDVDASTDRAGTKDQGGLEELKRTARALFRLIYSTPACRPSQQPDTLAPGSSTADPACPVAQDADVGLLTDSDRYQQPILIVRAGSLGSYTISNDSYLTTKSDGSGTEEFHTPAYWRKGEQGSVIDPTGGGNAFMGGLCAGMIASGGDIREGESGLPVPVSDHFVKCQGRSRLLQGLSSAGQRERLNSLCTTSMSPRASRTFERASGWLC